MKRSIYFTLFTLFFAIVITAQEAFNLPTELYVLLNEGVVQRYGLGTEGVAQVTPDGQFVVDFGISPEGGWITYRTPDALVLAPVLGDGEATVLARNPPLPPVRGDGVTIAWSPDARALAYTTEVGFRVDFRIVEPPLTPTVADITDSFGGGGFSDLRWSLDGRYIAARSVVEEVWQVYLTERTSLSLVSVVPPAYDVLWLTDSLLLFAPLEGGLVQMNLASANAQTSVLPPQRRYDVLFRRDDGAVMAFSRLIGTTDDTGRYTIVNPVAGTTEQPGEEDVPLTGLSWTPNGALNVTFQGGGLALVSPVNGAGFPLPISGAVAYDWGRPPLPRVTGYSAPSNLFFIATDEADTAQVWQLYQNATPPTPITNAAADVVGYAVSTDGFSIGYASDGGIWLQRLNDGSDPVRLTAIDASAPVHMDFSSDNLTIAYSDLAGIWAVPVTGGEPSLLLANTPPTDTPDVNARQFTNPRYAPNFGAMLVDIFYYEGSSTGILDLNTGELLELPFGYNNAVWMYNGQVFTYGAVAPFSQAGAHVTDPAAVAIPEIRIPPSVSVEHAVLIPTRTREDIRLILDPKTVGGPTPLRVYDYRDGAGLVPVWEAGFAAYPKLSPDGTIIAGYVRSEVNLNGIPRGRLTLVELITGEQVALESPSVVWDMRWQR